MLEKLWYVHLITKAELRHIQHVLQWVKHKYVKAFALATGGLHCTYFALVSATGHGMYVYPAGALMVVTLLTLLSGEEH